MKRLILIFRNTKTGDEEYYLVTTLKNSEKIKTLLNTIEWTNPINAVRELENMGFIISYLRLDDNALLERGNPKGGIVIDWE